jgi:hypothetical protein
MIFTGFKRKSIQIFFKKHLQDFVRNSNEIDAGKIKNALVFTDDLLQKSTILSGLQQVLNLSEANIEILIFQKKNEKSNTEEGVFSPKDFGWDGKIKSEKITAILTKKYDLLINYSKVENIYSNLLILQSKTAFNVGFGHFDNRLYDLLIKCKTIDMALFNEELKKYLAIFKKI